MLKYLYEILKYLNEKLTDLCVVILKIIHWENTKSNQQIISMILGYLVSFILICIRMFISS